MDIVEGKEGIRLPYFFKRKNSDWREEWIRSAAACLDCLK